MDENRTNNDSNYMPPRETEQKQSGTSAVYEEALKSSAVAEFAARKEMRRERRRTGDGVKISDKEWKRAIFQRWDDYRMLRRDVLFKLNALQAELPDAFAAAEEKIKQLKKSEEKIAYLIESIESLDDSEWDRNTLQSELASAMKKVENGRLECMMITEKLAGRRMGASNSAERIGSASFIHEISALPMRQIIRFAFAFFLPLVAGIIIAVLILAGLNYIVWH